MRKTKLWLVTMAALLCSITVSAGGPGPGYHFIVDDIYYWIISESDLTVAVSTEENYTFGGDYSEEIIVIPETVEYNNQTYRVISIGDHAFDRCDNLKSITIPESVTSIGISAFLGCYSLTAITIPESVTSIGISAFSDCSSLTSITIPEGVTSIGIGAFSGCYSLKTVINYSDLDIQKGSESYGRVAYFADRVINGKRLIDDYGFNTIDGVHYLIGYVGDDTELTLPKDYQGENYQIGESAFSDCSSLTNITIPEGVTSIGDKAFYGCTSLTDITIPEGVTSIGSYAFFSCSSLTDITIPKGVTSIGNSAFEYCSSLTDITIPEGVTSIGTYAFGSCSSIKSINIPEGVTSIGSNAFYGCTGELTINIDIPSGEYYNPTFYGSEFTKVIIEDKVTSIGDYAFYNCNNLTDITIPESVTNIGECAFDGCNSLSAVYISSLEAWCRISFASNPLSYAKNLYLNGELVTELIIPEGVTSIGDRAFYGCTSLTAITIPEGVTSIGNSAFEYCSNFTSVTIPSSVTSIGWFAFNNCSSLSAVYISSIEAWCNINFTGFAYEGSNPLYDAHNLYLNGELVTELVIPDGVTKIGWLTFQGLTGIKELTLGKGLRRIDSGVFSGCEEIEKITISATQPPTTTGNIFSEEIYENAMLYVPQGSISKYQVMTGWSGFYNISEIEGGTPDYLTIRQADNGAVGIAVDLGRTYKVCITPSENWTVHSVTFNGEDITSLLKDDNTLTTPTITGSSELNVAYEQVNNTVKTMRANAVKVSGYEGIITIDGCAEGDNITLYTTDGAIVAQKMAEEATTRITVDAGQLYIVKVADKVVKILM